MPNLLLGIGAALLSPAMAAACPAVASGAIVITLTEADLAAPHTVNTGAGGTIQLSACGYTAGFVNATPQISIFFTETRRPLQLSTSGNCDTVILVRALDSAGRFNDDNGASYLSLVSVDVVPGRMDVWVGLHDGQPSASQLTLS